MNIFLGLLCFYLAGAVVAWGLAYVHFSRSSKNRAMLSAIVVGITWIYGLYRYGGHRLKR